MRIDNIQECDLLAPPARITLFYDVRLQKITGRDNELIVVNAGCPFIFVLHSVFTAYPELERKYPPGVLGFTLNGRPPDSFKKIKDGDKICFLIPSAPDLH